MTGYRTDDITFCSRDKCPIKKCCGYETKAYCAATSVLDTESSRIGNFVLNQSLASAIHSAVKDWNGGKKDAIT
jgi:hypothetical protein